jgi:hypothetical protein
VLDRARHLAALRSLLRTYPVVAIVGARQVGKTTLARRLTAGWRGRSTTFDLEDSADLARLADPILALDGLTGLVVLDEVQRRPDLFTALRVLVDRPRPRTRFLVLGSASPALLRQSAESLAGLVVVHAGRDTFALAPRVRAVAAACLLDDVHPLGRRVGTRTRVSAPAR